MGKRVVAISFFFLLSAWLSFRAFEHRANNWDALGYAAVALTWTEADPAIVHERVYAAAREAVDPGTYGALTESERFRRAVYEDADLFGAQLAFYRDRLVYVALIHVLVTCGVNAFVAPFVVTAASYFALLLGFGGMLFGASRRIVALPIASLLGCAPFLAIPATLGTPDVLCALFVLGAAHAFATRGMGVAFLLCMVSAILTRADSFVFFAVLSVVGFWGAAGSAKRAALVAGALAVFTYTLLTLSTGRAGWWRVFEFTFVHMDPRWFERDTSPNVSTYLQVLLRHFEPREWGQAWLWMGLSLAALAMRPRKDALGLLLVACMTTCVVRYFLMPRLWDWDRLFTPYFAVMMLVVAWTISAPGRAGDQGSTKRTSKSQGQCLPVT